MKTAIKEKLNTGKTSFKQWWKNLWTLTIMQLKDKFSFSFAADKKSAIMKIVTLFLGFAIVTAVCYGVIAIFGMLRVFSLFDYVPVGLLTIVFTVMLGLSIITCTNGLTNTLYFSQDNQVLLAFPVQPNVVFLSKLNVYYITELIKNFLFIIPLFLAYGITYGFVWYYYIWIIFCFILIALIPVLIGALLSLVFMWVKIFFKRFPFANTAFIFAVLITIFTFAVWLIYQLPENIDIRANWGTTFWEIQDFINAWNKTMSPIRSLVDIIIGRGATPYNMTLFNQFTLPILGIIIAFILVSGLASFFLAKPIFFKMATKPFEFSKKTIAHDFRISRQSFDENVKGYIFRIKDETLRNNENIYRSVLKKIWKENLFNNKKIDSRRILRILKSISGYEFICEKAEKDNDFRKTGLSFVILEDYGINHLVLLKKFNKVSYHVFDPIHLSKTNVSVRSTFVASLWKEILLSIRTPEIIISNFVLFAITPLATLLLNKIFSAMNTRIMGGHMVVAINVLIILLLVLTSAASFASIYSKEGKNAYLLKAAPINYTRNLLSKLVVNTFVILISIITTGILFAYTNKDAYKDAWMLFASIYFIYLAVSLWSAELDFMNPQDKIYATSSGAVTNPNEIKSAVIAFVVSALIAFISFFLLEENVTTVFIKILIIGLIFFIVRAILFTLKVKAYTTSRGETSK
ncbi:MAG: hypothetical protein LBM03_01270 [Erysipelotrichaceae bacterium]|jgi:hypothetical protein|nr:hypothetical protein [Erysipelotrichaceae bacterium]